MEALHQGRIVQVPETEARYADEELGFNPAVAIDVGA
jgi:hypothetical protein